MAAIVGVAFAEIMDGNRGLIREMYKIRALSRSGVLQAQAHCRFAESCHRESGDNGRVCN